MKRRIVALLSVLALLCAAIPALAETEALPASCDASRLYGTWSVMYYIEQGVSITAGSSPDYPHMDIIISESGISAIQDGQPTDNRERYRVISDSSISIGNILFSLADANLMISLFPGSNALVLKRTGGIPFDSPFAGEWNVLTGSENGEVYDSSAIGTAFVFTFSADQVVLSISDSTTSYPCVYDGNACEIITETESITAVINDAGLITVTVPQNNLVLLLIRTQ